MKEKLYVIVFALVISAAASVILTFSNSVLKERIERNKELELYTSVLSVLEIELDGDENFEEIEQKFREHAKQIYREEEVGGKIKGLDIYRGVKDGEVVGYVIKIAGAGFWGPIKGFIALEPDMKTIKGITFYEQEETPGLGGRIVEKEFQEQFVKGKAIYSAEGDLGFYLTPAKGPLFDLVGKQGTEFANEVDAITGATETSSALQKFLNKALDTFDEIKRKNNLEAKPEIKE